MIWKMFNPRKGLMIDSKEKLEEAALYYGILPFFRNNVSGLSVEEMTAPGCLFGGLHDDGCWEWKGPVIREKTTAYGKFFKRKAGFVSLKLLPDFLNYRRAAYPVKPDSTDEMILDIIRENEGLSSTELRQYIFGATSGSRRPFDLPDNESPVKSKRSSLEGPLQRLQMGGRLLISDFKYKITKKGERYGWGIAVYSTPELWFGKSIIKTTGNLSPEDSLSKIIDYVEQHFKRGDRKKILQLLL